MKTYRQGDILLIEIAKIPDGAVLQHVSNSIVLGEGETAGHRHEIREINKVSSYKSAEGFYLDALEETPLVHPKHKQVALFPGIQEVIHQYEFQRKEIIRVQD